MKSVSFDNPYLFLIAIPLILLVVIPFIIAIKKENRQKTTVASLIIHIAIIVLVSFAAAGTKITDVKTETTVYVVADVSYSSERNLDLIDEYIEDLKINLPPNTKLGVICFGATKEPEILYRAGESSKSVKESTVEDYATDISSAILFAANDDLFPQENIKKMVLITDGKDTVGGTQGGLVSAIGAAEAKGIEVSAIYLDNNIKDDQLEIQIADLQGISKVFSQTENELKVLLQSNYDSQSIEGKTKLTVYEKLHSADESEYKELDLEVDLDDIELLTGFNMQTIKLPQRGEGVYDYKVVVTPAKDADLTVENNTYTFTMEVSDEIKVLVLSGTKADAQAIMDVYDGMAELETYVVDLDKNEKSRVRRLLEDGSLQASDLPYTVEALSKYDEIILSNVDIRAVPNVTSFMHCVEIVVSEFGKSLTTMGNLEVQNKENTALGALEDMLPINYGNANEDKKLYTLVIDTSHSINQAYKFRAAKEISKNLVSLLNDEDYVAIVSFSGEVAIELNRTVVGPNREKILSVIDNLELGQGTLLGTGLETAYQIADAFDAGESQVMLISDGKTSDYDLNARDLAKRMKQKGIVVSTINIATYEQKAMKLLEDIAKLTGGTPYVLENVDKVEEFVFAEVADELTESIVERESPVHVKKPDPILNGITSEPAPIYGYVQTDSKADATVYLTVDYKKNESDDSVVHVPLYSVRGYGNGKVATFASALSNGWLDGWDESFTKTFFVNMLNSNLPKENIDYPYTIDIERGIVETELILTPSDVRSDAKAFVVYSIYNEETGVYEEVKREMSFDSQKYSVIIDTNKVNIYDVQFIYTYEECPGYLMDVVDNGENIAQIIMQGGLPSTLVVGEREYPLKKVFNKKEIGLIKGTYTYTNENGELVFTMAVDTTDTDDVDPSITITYQENGQEVSKSYGYVLYKGDIANAYVQIPYLPEYDAFTVYTPSVLNATINGKVVNGFGLTLENDENEVEIYEKPLMIYFLIAAMVLFIVDVAIRVIKIKKKKGAKR